MMIPTRRDVKVFGTVDDLRAWFEGHHDGADEQWIGYYRKGIGKTSISYREAVDEALCFGWIDGITRRIDDEIHANRFTPRTKRSTWSAVNVARIGELIGAGRVHPAGIAAFERRTAENTGIYSYENRPADLPPAYLSQLKANPVAWDWWQAQRPGYRRIATWWVVSAKQQATRDRRLLTLIQDAAAGRMIKSQRRDEPGQARR